MIVAATELDNTNTVSWLRVVLADSDLASRQFYQAALAHEGLDVVTASSGLECVELLRDCPPDALILDLNLPWGGAEGVLAIMAEEPDLAQIPVLVHTFCSDPQIWRAIGKLRVSDFHWKPTTSEKLGARLRALVNYSRSHSTPSRKSSNLGCA